MKRPFSLKHRPRDSRGATLVWVAILLAVFLAFAALAVDVGYMMVTRNESQNAADAAALAGARRLGQNYHKHISPVTTGVITSAQDAAAQNKVATENLADDNAIKKIGTWDTSTRAFTETATDPNAVQVEVKRQAGLTSGPVKTLFAPIMGVTAVNSRAIACAAISGTCNAVPGIPLGIGRSWFTNLHANNFCTQIALNDTGSSCAGWTNLSRAKYKHQQVVDMLNDPSTIPTVHAGDVVEFGGGTVTPVLNALEDLFNRMKSGTPPTWTTAVIVYEDYGSCENPNKGYAVLGFATVKITGIETHGSNKGPYGEVQCGIAVDDRGGCFYAGTYGNIPGLVK